MFSVLCVVCVLDSHNKAFILCIALQYIDRLSRLDDEDLQAESPVLHPGAVWRLAGPCGTEGKS